MFDPGGLTFHLSLTMYMFDPGGLSGGFFLYKPDNDNEDMGLPGGF
jgi:hypothetical protein